VVELEKEELSRLVEDSGRVVVPRERYDLCADLVDVFDDTRFAVWGAIERYTIGYGLDEPRVMEAAARSIRAQKGKMDAIYRRALERGAPKIREVEGWMEETKRDLEVVARMMDARVDPYELEESQLDLFEKPQFDRQHRTLLLCLDICLAGAPERQRRPRGARG